MTTEPIRKYRFTVDDYHRMGETGVIPQGARVELIEGEVLEMSPIGRDHASRVNRITLSFVRRFGGRAIVSVQNPVRLGRDSEPQPDVVLLRLRDDFYASAAPTAADTLLVVEVGDTTVESDRRIKVPFYARKGISEVWLLDIPANSIDVFRHPETTGYASHTIVPHDGALIAEAFPGEAIPAEELLG